VWKKEGQRMKQKKITQKRKQNNTVKEIQNKKQKRNNDKGRFYLLGV